MRIIRKPSLLATLPCVLNLQRHACFPGSSAGSQALSSPGLDSSQTTTDAGQAAGSSFLSTQQNQPSQVTYRQVVFRFAHRSTLHMWQEFWQMCT